MSTPLRYDAFLCVDGTRALYPQPNVPPDLYPWGGQLAGRRHN